MKVLLTFTEDVLGTLAANPKVAEEFILDKHPDGISKEELAAQREPDEQVEKSSTIFPRDEDGMPIIWDYQFKGFFKAACQAMIDTGTMTQEELKKVRFTKYMHKRTIDTLIFVSPRKIRLQLPDGCDFNKLEFCERPLRGETMQGERISLARSEIVPAGSKVEFEITCLNDKYPDFVKQWLTYGALYGMLQWRNSGKGRFSWQELS